MEWTEDELVGHLRRFHGDKSAGLSDPRAYNAPVYSNAGFYVRRHRHEHAAHNERAHGPSKQHGVMENSLAMRFQGRRT